MNKFRRRLLKALIVALSKCADEIESIKEDEDESRENIPENLQNTNNYLWSEECSDILNEATLDIQGIIEGIEKLL